MQATLWRKTFFSLTQDCCTVLRSVLATAPHQAAAIAQDCVPVPQSFTCPIYLSPDPRHSTLSRSGFEQACAFFENMHQLQPSVIHYRTEFEEFPP